MRYNDDVINAESWNAGLTKADLHSNPDADEIAGQQNKTISKSSIPAAVHLSAPPDAQEINHTPETDLVKTGPSEKNEAASITDKQPVDKDLQVSNPDIIRITKINPSPVNLRASKYRINRRKKRGVFLLSGLLTGLVSRSRDLK